MPNPPIPPALTEKPMGCICDMHSWTTVQGVFTDGFVNPACPIHNGIISAPTGTMRMVWMDQVDVLIKSLDRLSTALEKQQAPLLPPPLE